MTTNQQKIVDILNKARSMEMESIHQYMVQHYLLDSLNYEELAKFQKLIAVDEMRHAERFAERIREIGGIPTCERNGKIILNQTLEEIYSHDINLESNTVEQYTKFIQECKNLGDSTTAELFNDILAEEKIHLSQYEDDNSKIQEYKQNNK